MSSYQEFNQIDGKEQGGTLNDDAMEVSLKEAEGSLLKHKSANEYLKLYEYLDLDWSLADMVNKMREAIKL